MKEGNILSVKSGIVVQGCNAQGVMGSGLAKQIRSLYPEAYDTYKKEYELKNISRDKGKSWLGSVVYVLPSEKRGFFIANAITQQFYGRNPSVTYVNYQAVDKCFKNIASFAQKHNLKVHYPMIGAGLGGGDWDIIKPIIDENLKNVESSLWIMPPKSNKKFILSK